MREKPYTSFTTITGFGLDDQGLTPDRGWNFLFAITSRSIQGPTELPIQWVPIVLSLRSKAAAAWISTLLAIVRYTNLLHQNSFNRAVSRPHTSIHDKRFTLRHSHDLQHAYLGLNTLVKAQLLSWFEPTIVQPIVLLFISIGWHYVSELRTPKDLAFILQMIYERGESRWNYTDKENRRTQRKSCPSATFSTTCPTWTGPGENMGPLGKRPSTLAYS
jgi:hypothetical protein